METEFLVAALSAVEARQGDPRELPGLQAAVRRFRDDERRHADIWHNLNRLSEPEWYASTNWRLLGIPRAALTAARLVARPPCRVPVVFWLQLVQEERSLDISRRCMRMSPQAMEPRYAAAYMAHLPDEARHVQIDRHLIDTFYRPRSLAVRRATALLFRGIVGTLLMTPVHSTARVVRALADEYPELAPLVPRMLGELASLPDNADYHEMMYSRRTTPVTFELFDEFPEFHQMRAVLRGYEPRPRRETRVMRKTYRIPNVLNALVMTAQCAGIAACLLAARSVQSGAGLLLLAVAFAIVMNSVYAMIHEAEHRMLFATAASTRPPASCWRCSFPRRSTCCGRGTSAITCAIARTTRRSISISTASTRYGNACSSTAS